MDIGLRTFLIATAIAFPVIALIAFVIILFKIKNKQKKKRNQYFTTINTKIITWKTFRENKWFHFNS